MKFMVYNEITVFNYYDIQIEYMGHSISHRMGILVIHVMF